MGHLSERSLLSHFHCVRSRDDVEHPKPAPDVYLAALDHLGVAPHEAIALEDSPHGVTAAKAAGLYCVAVPNDITAGLCFDHADLVLESLVECSLTQLIAARQ